jgi:hypothetical protein
LLRKAKVRQLENIRNIQQLQMIRVNRFTLSHLSNRCYRYA